MAKWVKAFAMQGYQPEFNPQDPHKGVRIPKLSPDLHMQTVVCVPIHPYSDIHNNNSNNK